MSMGVSPAVSSRVRPFTEDDIPAVAELHRRVFGVAEHMNEQLLAAYRTYFSQVLLNHPWRDLDTQCLVYQEKPAAVVGFIGLTPRPFTLAGRPVQAKVVTQFVVAPESRGVTGVTLLRTAFAGPEDLTLADEASSNLRRLWEGLGAATSLLFSMNWMFALRPCLLAERLLLRKSGPLGVLLRAGANWWLDPLLTRIPGSPIRVAAPQLTGEDLSTDELFNRLAALDDDHLRPQYDPASFAWVLGRAERLAEGGRLQRVLLRSEGGEVVGWYLYHLNHGDLSQVLHLYAQRHWEKQVLDHLFWHARRHGAAGLNGRLDPSLTQALSDRRCFYHCGPQWFLVHSRRPELLRLFEQGRVSISRLDGEWTLHLR